MNELQDALETGLQALEGGADLDAVLQRQPELVDKLRPLLEVSIHARDLQTDSPPAYLLRRARAGLLQRAAELRAARKPAGRPVLPTFPRLAVALTLAAVLLLTGTGLVSASAGALPGEALYAVKRGWEDVRLFLAVDPQSLTALQGEQEQERLDEVLDVLQEGRTVSVTFRGQVTGRQADQLVVSGVVVGLSAQTQLSGDFPTIGAAVSVTGDTTDNGVILATSIQTLPLGSLVPSGELIDLDQQETQFPAFPDSGPGAETGSSSGPDAGSARPEEQGPLRSFHLAGIVDSIQGNTWTIAGHEVEMENVRNQSSVSVGSRVAIEGYFAADGRFIVTRIKLVEHDPGAGAGGDGGGGSPDEDGEGDDE